MSLNIFSITLYEFDVAATDVLLFALCLYLGLRIAKTTALNSKVRTLCVSLFLSLAASALLGGVFHAFFPLKSSTPSGLALWLVLSTSLGITIVSFLLIPLYTLFQKRWQKLLLPLGFFIFVSYMLLLLLVDHTFKTIVLFYLPAIIFFVIVSFIQVLRKKEAGWGLACIGGLLTLAAAYVQQAGINLHPIYFNFNALYHVIQAVALIFMYKGFKKFL